MARDRFDVARCLGFVAESRPQPAYGCIERGVVVDDPFRPEQRDELFPRHDLAGPGEQLFEDLQRLFLQSNACAVVQQFPGLPAQSPVVEADLRCVVHRRTRAYTPLPHAS